MLSRESRKMAGLLLVIFPSVIFGGVSLLSFILGKEAGYLDNRVRQDLFRAGHAHAGVLLILSLLALRYADDARLPPAWKFIARSGTPAAAIFLPAGFFFSVLTPAATEPNGFIYLAFAGAVILAVSLAALGVGLLRNRQ